MHRIMHRVNTIEQLVNTPVELGIEVDIRSYDKEIIIHHDPFIIGESFDKWLNFFKHGLLILNVKEEGLEKRLLELMKKNDIEDFFFLDQSFPFLKKTIDMGENRCAVRISEYESIETALSLSGKVEWAWIDCFSKFPLKYNDAKNLKDAGYKLCFVSPELQGPIKLEKILLFKKNIESLGIIGDAVCTKQPDIWL